jgi:hypothetical protein
MPRNRMNKVYSIYHSMEDRGLFEMNKANTQAVSNDGLSIYEGPVQYPKMLYHPKGELHCISQGILVTDRDSRPVFDERGQPKYAGAVWGVKNVIVESEAQEEEMIALGWHYTEAQALRANPETHLKAPPKTRHELQDEEIAELRRQLEEMKGKVVPTAAAAGLNTATNAGLVANKVGVKA